MPGAAQRGCLADTLAQVASVPCCTARAHRERLWGQIIHLRKFGSVNRVSGFCKPCIQFRAHRSDMAPHHRWPLARTQGPGSSAAGARARGAPPGAASRQLLVAASSSAAAWRQVGPMGSGSSLAAAGFHHPNPFSHPASPLNPPPLRPPLQAPPPANLHTESSAVTWHANIGLKTGHTEHKNLITTCNGVQCAGI